MRIILELTYDNAHARNEYTACDELFAEIEAAKSQGLDEVTVKASNHEVAINSVVYYCQLNDIDRITYKYGEQVRLLRTMGVINFGYLPYETGLNRLAEEFEIGLSPRFKEIEENYKVRDTKKVIRFDESVAPINDQSAVLEVITYLEGEDDEKFEELVLNSPSVAMMTIQIFCHSAKVKFSDLTVIDINGNEMKLSPHIQFPNKMENGIMDVFYKSFHYAVEGGL